MAGSLLCSPALSWCSQCCSLGSPLTAAQSSCWSCLYAGARLQVAKSKWATQICGRVFEMNTVIQKLTFIVLGSPFLISWTPRSFLLSRTVQENNNNNNNDELVWKARFLDCLVDYNRALITQCTAESGVRLSFGWSLSTLPAVTSSHKAALSHRSLPSDADAADRGNVTKTYKY